MRCLAHLFVVLLFVATTNAQSKRISKQRYEKVIQFAEEKTNAAYPVVLEVTTSFIENGKKVRMVTDVSEVESLMRRREKRTIVEGIQTTEKYQVSLAPREVYCSDDGATWVRRDHECWLPVVIYGRRQVEAATYRVAIRRKNNRRVKLYQEYSIHAGPAGQNEFRKRVASIDSWGQFISILDIEGTLNPRRVKIVRKQSWVTNAAITPIVAP